MIRPQPGSGTGMTALTNDVTASGPGSAAATVAAVGGSTAANVHAAELLANAATSANTVSAIVKRDGSGNFSAGTITAAFTGNVTGNVTGNLTGTILTAAQTNITSVGTLSALTIGSGNLLFSASDPEIRLNSGGSWLLGATNTMYFGTGSTANSGNARMTLTASSLSNSLLYDSTVASGSNAYKMLDGGRLNFSTADASAYLYRSTTNTIRTPGNLTVDGTTTGTFVGNITGNVTGNASGTAATVTGAAQSAITSVGTLTSLAVSGLTSSSVASGSDSFKLVDGAHLNFSTADTSAYLYRSATDTIRTPGSFTVDGTITGNVTGNVTGTIQTAAQANITSLGTLSAITVSGTSNLNGTVNVAAAQPTAQASGTGISNVLNGKVTQGVTVLQITSTAWITAGASQTITLVTFPARARLIACYADTTVAYAGLAGTIQIKVGSTSGGAEIILGHDVKTATVTKGLLDADLGASFTRAACIQGGFLSSWSGSSSLFVTLTSGTGNIGNGATSNLSQGTTRFYVIYETL